MAKPEKVEAVERKARGPVDPNSSMGVRNTWARAEREYHAQAKRVQAMREKLKQEETLLHEFSVTRASAAERLKAMLDNAKA